MIPKLCIDDVTVRSNSAALTVPHTSIVMVPFHLFWLSSGHVGVRMYTDSLVRSYLQSRLNCPSPELTVSWGVIEYMVTLGDVEDLKGCSMSLIIVE